MAGPNVQNTEHPLYGGGNPDYMGVAGGSMGFFQDPYGATFVGFISGTTLTITISGSGSVVAGATINGAGVTAGTTISALGTALGIYYLDIPVPQRQRAPVRFTFCWTDGNRWEGRDFAVEIGAPGK